MGGEEGDYIPIATLSPPPGLLGTGKVYSLFRRTNVVESAQNLTPEISVSWRVQSLL